MSQTNIQVHTFTDNDGAKLHLYRRKDGFFDATHMCKSSGKKWYDYVRLYRTTQFLEQLIPIKGKPKSDLIQIYTTGLNEQRGTWVCPEIALNLASWISPTWAVQVATFMANCGENQLRTTGSSQIYEDMLQQVEEEGKRPVKTEGILYAVTSQYFNAVKLGFWTGTFEELQQRYQTYFTKSLQFHTKHVKNARLQESVMLSHFAEYKLDGEVFRKDHWSSYVKYIDDLVDRSKKPTKLLRFKQKSTRNSDI